MLAKLERTRYADKIRQLVKGRADADETQEQWDCLRRRLGRRAVEPKIKVAEFYQAYEQATGTLIGCD